MPSLTVEQVTKAARWTRNVSKTRSSSSKDCQADKEVWARSKAEIQKHHLRGPFTSEQLSAMLGPLFVVSRRFGIQQGDKVRPVDDMSESLVNSCYGSVEKVDLGGVDELAVLLRTFLDGAADNGDLLFHLSDGAALEGRLHPSISVLQARTLVGRTLDLEDAYRQLVVSKPSMWASVLQIFNHDLGKDELYLSEGLPFGAAASVLVQSLQQSAEKNRNKIVQHAVDELL